MGSRKGSATRRASVEMKQAPRAGNGIKAIGSLFERRDSKGNALSQLQLLAATHFAIQGICFPTDTNGLSTNRSPFQNRFKRSKNICTVEL